MFIYQVLPWRLTDQTSLVSIIYCFRNVVSTFQTQDAVKSSNVSIDSGGGTVPSEWSEKNEWNIKCPLVSEILCMYVHMYVCIHFCSIWAVYSVKIQLTNNIWVSTMYWAICWENKTASLTFLPQWVAALLFLNLLKALSLILSLFTTSSAGNLVSSVFKA